MFLYLDVNVKNTWVYLGVFFYDITIGIHLWPFKSWTELTFNQIWLHQSKPKLKL